MATSPHVTRIPITSALSRREKEAEIILRTSSNSNHTSLVCAWFPFPEHKTVDLLSTRMATLGKVLNQNDSKSPRCDLVRSLPSLDSATKFEEMARADQRAYANQIALTIDSIISTALHDTPFSEVVRAACGLKSSGIQKLLDVALQLRTELSKLFQRLDQPSRLYDLVYQASFIKSYALHSILIFLTGATFSPPFGSLDLVHQPARRQRRS